MLAAHDIECLLMALHNTESFGNLITALVQGFVAEVISKVEPVKHS